MRCSGPDVAAADPFDVLRAQVAARLRERDAAIEAAAVAWASYVRRQGWSRGDLEHLWEGLSEELVRRVGRARGADRSAVGGEVLAVLATVRAQIVARLAERERP